MELGKPEKEYIIEPIESPAPAERTPAPEEPEQAPKEVPVEVPERERVPA